MVRTDGLDEFLTVSDAFDVRGVRLRVSTCMRTLISMSSNYFKPIVVNIEEEQRKVEIRELNDRLAKLVR